MTYDNPWRYGTTLEGGHAAESERLQMPATRPDEIAAAQRAGYVNRMRRESDALDYARKTILDLAKALQTGQLPLSRVEHCLLRLAEELDGMTR